MNKGISLLLIIIGFFVLPVIAFGVETAADVLTLEHYLQQVKSKNGTYLSLIEAREGARGVMREADLIFSPSFFVDVQGQSDHKQGYGALYDKTEGQNYSSGLSQTSRYGLQVKMYYAFDDTKYHYGGYSDKYYDGSPVVELSLPLWKNALGRSDRANEEATRAQAQADEWNAESNRKTLLVSAEISYWRLVVARELVDIQQRGLKASQAIYDYVNQRVRMNLADQADALQAKASLESKKLDLKSAQDEESAAMRSFNAYRVSTEGHPFLLVKIDWERIKTISAPDTFEIRADVKAAEFEARATAANARIQEERNKPTLNVYAAYAFNGNSARSSDAFSHSFSSERPTATAGLKFSVPLDLTASHEARAGARHKEYAAKLAYQQKLRDQESDWRDLVAKLKNARERLEMTFTIEAAQKQKLEYERDRLKRGRTTTYQVLLFEQDYLQAEYSRANAAYEVLSLLANVNLYRNSPDQIARAKTEVTS